MVFRTFPFFFFGFAVNQNVFGYSKLRKHALEFFNFFFKLIFYTCFPLTICNLLKILHQGHIHNSNYHYMRCHNI